MQGTQPPSDGDTATPDPLSAGTYRSEWTQIGAAFLASGGAGVLGTGLELIHDALGWHNPWLWYAGTVSLGCVAVGVYGVFGPYFGCRMPEPRPEYSAQWRAGGVWLLVVLVAVPIVIRFTTGQQREFVSVSPSYLEKLRNGRSTRDANRLVAPYIGKWIRVSGTVTDIEDGNVFTFGHATVSVADKDAENGLADISAYFEGWFGNWFGFGISESVKTLRVKDKITLTCAIDAVFDNLVFLDYCELVS